MAQSITSIGGIGESTKGALAERGFTSVADLAEATIDQLITVKGFGRARASRTIAAAAELLNSVGRVAPAPDVASLIDVAKPTEMAMVARPSEAATVAKPAGNKTTVKSTEKEMVTKSEKNRKENKKKKKENKKKKKEKENKKKKKDKKRNNKKNRKTKKK